MKIIRSSAALACLALLLTGCGGAPADGGSYKDATALKDALIKAGGTCDDWDAHNKSTLAESSGSCGEKFALSVYSDPENLKLWVDTTKKLGSNAVVGKNWAISGLEAESVHKLLGGELLGK